MSSKWIICTLCSGDGHYVNPAIDSHGISAEELADDPEFAEQYMSGAYDEQCRRCGGTGKVLAADMPEILRLEDCAIEDRRLAAAEDGDVEGWLTASDRRW